MELIEVKEVSKEYNGSSILDAVSLVVEEGDIFGIIGQSGSGKTTLLNIIAGFVEPNEGNVFYVSKIDHQPKNLTENFQKIKRHIGFTHQHYSFYPKLTVKENVIHFGSLHGVQKGILVENAKAMLEFTGLYEHRNKLAEHLSGGMKRRLDITCSLMHKPKVLLLDEPTADLDPVLQKDIIRLIQEVNKQGITIIIASHHLESLERICTKLVLLHKGKVHSQGDVEEVKKPFLKENVTINVRTGSDKAKILQLVRRLPVQKIIDQGHQLVLESSDPARTIVALMAVVKEENLFLHDIDVRKPTLSEIFEKIAGK